jgi:hypothetical protein
LTPAKPSIEALTRFKQLSITKFVVSRVIGPDNFLQRFDAVRLFVEKLIFSEFQTFFNVLSFKHVCKCKTNPYENGKRSQHFGIRESAWICSGKRLSSKFYAYCLINLLDTFPQLKFQML